MPKTMLKTAALKTGPHIPIAVCAYAGLTSGVVSLFVFSVLPVWLTHSQADITIQVASVWASTPYALKILWAPWLDISGQWTDETAQAKRENHACRAANDADHRGCGMRRHEGDGAAPNCHSCQRCGPCVNPDVWGEDCLSGHARESQVNGPCCYPCGQDVQTHQNEPWSIENSAQPQQWHDPTKHCSQLEQNRLALSRRQEQTGIPGVWVGVSIGAHAGMAAGFGWLGYVCLGMANASAGTEKWSMSGSLGWSVVGAGVVLSVCGCLQDIVWEAYRAVGMPARIQPTAVAVNTGVYRVGGWLCQGVCFALLYQAFQGKDSQNIQEAAVKMLGWILCGWGACMGLGAGVIIVLAHLWRSQMSDTSDPKTWHSRLPEHDAPAHRQFGHLLTCFSPRLCLRQRLHHVLTARPWRQWCQIFGMVATMRLSDLGLALTLPLVMLTWKRTPTWWAGADGLMRLVMGTTGLAGMAWFLRTTLRYSVNGRQQCTVRDGKKQGQANPPQEQAVRQTQPKQWSMTHPQVIKNGHLCTDDNENVRFESQNCPPATKLREQQNRHNTASRGEDRDCMKDDALSPDSLDASSQSADTDAARTTRCTWNWSEAVERWIPWWHGAQATICLAWAGLAWCQPDGGLRQAGMLLMGLAVHYAISNAGLLMQQTYVAALAGQMPSHVCFITGVLGSWGSLVRMVWATGVVVMWRACQSWDLGSLSGTCGMFLVLAVICASSALGWGMCRLSIDDNHGGR